MPYATGKSSLDAIGEVYRGLINDNRLVIPGHVIREFASNRVVKLQELHQQLTRKTANLGVARARYPLLDGLPVYEKMSTLEKELETHIQSYKDAVNEVLTTVRQWNWNDPVSMLYKDLFQGGVVQDPRFDQEDLKQDFARRIENKIPPGYKDAGKDDGGIGDLIIWRTILEVGKARKKPLIFVSGDVKGDWWHQSEGRPLYPRFELIDEYRRNSDGQTLHLATFSAFLELVGSDAKIVGAVREKEAQDTAQELPPKQEPEPSIADNHQDWHVRGIGVYFAQEPSRNTLEGIMQVINLWLQRPTGWTAPIRHKASGLIEVEFYPTEVVEISAPRALAMKTHLSAMSGAGIRDVQLRLEPLSFQPSLGESPLGRYSSDRR